MVWFGLTRDQSQQSPTDPYDVCEQAEQCRRLQTPAPSTPEVRLKTIISPVPEEDEEDLEADGLEVQEVKEGQENVLRLQVPPALGTTGSRPNREKPFRLSRSNTRSPVCPSRSLSPCPDVPRHFSRPEHELYPVNLRRYSLPTHEQKITAKKHSLLWLSVSDGLEQ